MNHSLSLFPFVSIRLIILVTLLESKYPHFLTSSRFNLWFRILNSPRLGLLNFVIQILFKTMTFGSCSNHGISYSIIAFQKSLYVLAV